MALVDTENILEEEHHHHEPFIAHHFESAEQQFDSGKLGIWIFLVTEILFFSGLFVAYTLYRVLHPEIFEQAHHFLDKNLGAMNTIVLLFSSLTMALGVHAAQKAENKKCGMYVLITMVCAAMFLGVKAVEYSHKWDLGIFVRSAFSLNTHHAEGFHISPYLMYLSAIPCLLLVAFIAAAFFGKMTDNPIFSKFSAGMAITVGGYFLGVFVGMGFMALTADSSSHANLNVEPAQPVVLQAMTLDDEKHAHEEGHDHDHEHADGEHAHAEGSHGDGHDDAHHEEPPELSRDVGIFFSIYYCMTGLHAIHIIAGIIALAWIYWRCLALHWRADYFGPVDYVGLYWHLVDLIWIYLFPLLYLID